MMESKIAKITGTAIQDDETFKREGGFVPERDQLYFELKQGENIFLIGVKDVLKCLNLLEKMKEIPAINGKWWQQIEGLYGNDISVVDYKEKE